MSKNSIKIILGFGFILGIILVILMIVLLISNLNSSNNNIVSPNDIACTEEAKLCSDGSSVGRTGPNCEFADCPTTEELEVICTLDAMECPDGSYVGRTGPKCEFICP